MKGQVAVLRTIPASPGSFVHREIIFSQAIMVIDFYILAGSRNSNGMTGNKIRPTTCNCLATCEDQWFSIQLSSVPVSSSAFLASGAFHRVASEHNITIEERYIELDENVYFQFTNYVTFY